MGVSWACSRNHAFMYGNTKIQVRDEMTPSFPAFPASENSSPRTGVCVRPLMTIAGKLGIEACAGF